MNALHEAAKKNKDLAVALEAATTRVLPTQGVAEAAPPAPAPEAPAQAE